MDHQFIGDDCAVCGELIEDGSVSIVQAIHRECAFRMVSGGVNHQRGTCGCCGGDDDPDPPHLTERQAAIAAFYYFLGTTDGDGGTAL